MKITKLVKIAGFSLAVTSCGSDADDKQSTPAIKKKGTQATQFVKKLEEQGRVEHKEVGNMSECGIIECLGD